MGFFSAFLIYFSLLINAFLRQPDTHRANRWFFHSFLYSRPTPFCLILFAPHWRLILKKIRRRPIKKAQHDIEMLTGAFFLG